jgi:gliding motility-associated-like protein
MIVNGRPDLQSGIELDTQCNTVPTLALRANVSGSYDPSVVWEGIHVTGTNFLPINVQSDTAQDFNGPYVLRYSYQDPFTTCENFDSTSVVVQAQPTINILLPTANMGLCEDGIFLLNAESEHDNGILWSTVGDGGFVDAGSLNTEYNHGSGDKANKGVSLKIETLPYGPACPAVNTSVDVLIHPRPDVDFDSPVSECAPYTADFLYNDTGSLGLTNVAFEWDLDEGKTATTQDAIGILYSNEGSFDVSLIVRNMDVLDGSCFTTLTKPGYVNIHPIPVANFTMSPDGFTTVAIPEFSFENTSTISNGTIANYNWDLDMQNIVSLDPSERFSTEKSPVINYGTDTLSTCVQLSIISDQGCRDSIIKCLKVGPDVTVFIPNAFTPNGAGPTEDNTFWVSVNGHVGFNLQIFNRWGELLFESDKATEPLFGWDGTYNNGAIVQQDAYMYVCIVQGFDGETYEYKGTVTLLR